jgi:predicted ATP-grasp superfamily ATP-dependent carboligase
MQYEVPAVVVGINPTALGIVRSLTPHCRSITAIESNRDEPGTRTRLARVHLVDDLADHETLLAELVDLARTFDDRPVLFLSSDEHVIWASRNREALAAHFRLLLPSREACETLMFKDRFSELAVKQDLPLPRSAFLPTDGLAAHIGVSGLRYPVIVKPATKVGAWENQGLDKAYILRNPEEAAALGARARRAVPAVLAQEYLEGDDGHVYFCLYLGAPGLGAPLTFTGRKLLQWPPLRGSTAACEPAEVPGLEAMTRRLFDGLGVEGFASLEVKYDDSGAFKIIEPTIGRVDLQSYVATLNGMNMPLCAYLAAVGRLDEAQAYGHQMRSDVVWVYEASIWSLLRSHAVDGRSLLGLARRPKGFALGAWSDPGVLGAFAGSVIHRAARKAIGRLRATGYRLQPGTQP